LRAELFHQRQFFRDRFSTHSRQSPLMGGCTGFFSSSYATAGHSEQFVQKCQRSLDIARRYRVLMITSQDVDRKKQQPKYSEDSGHRRDKNQEWKSAHVRLAQKTYKDLVNLLRFLAPVRVQALSSSLPDHAALPFLPLAASSSWASLSSVARSTISRTLGNILPSSSSSA
jgi:hypothetical protein